MKDYHPKKGKYILPTSVYHQTIWIIRDYDRIVSELSDMMLASPAPPDGQPKGSSISDEVFAKTKRRDEYTAKKLAIEHGLEKVPEEYRRGVWDNIQMRKAFPHDAGRSTYSKWKSRFIYEVAVKMNFIEKR